MNSMKALFLDIWKPAACAFLVFFVGYFLFYGRAANISGSWDYVLRTADDSLYWASAEAAADELPSEGNPYYYENRGEQHSIPYPVATFVGWLAKIMSVPVLFFFPAWQIGMPFVLWLVLFLCLYRVWNYPKTPSALLSLIFLLSLLFFRDNSHEALFRFSRPGDALWLVFIAVSWIMHSEALTVPKKYLLAVMIIAVIWMNLFLALLVFVVLTGETAWQWAKNEKKTAKILSLMAGIFLAAVFSYWLYGKWQMSRQAEEFRALAQDDVFGTRQIEWISFFLYTAIAGLVFSAKAFLRNPWTKLDRLLLLIFLLEPLCGNIAFLLPENFQFGVHRYRLSAEFAFHRYVYMIPELVVLTGWMLEKGKILRTSAKFNGVGNYVAGLAAMILIYVFANGDLNPLRFAPNVSVRFGMPGPLLLLILIPGLFLFVWLYLRFSKVKALTHHPYFVSALLVIMTFVGYRGLAAQTYAQETHNYKFHDFPFAGAYEWLRQNAQKYDVVLTVPPTRLDIDYVIHHTDLKTFIHPIGETLAARSPDNENTFRFLFYYNLLVDDFKGFDYKGINSIEEKLTHLKLDYILIELPSPFISNIVSQLEGYFTPVYQDPTAILLKVSP